MKRTMKHRLAAVVLAGLGLSLAGFATLTPVAAQPERRAVASPETTLTVFQLKHINVHEFRAAAQNIAIDPYSILTVDDRSNSILLKATAESTQSIKELIEILDVQITGDEGDDEIKVFSLTHAAANGSLIASLAEVLHHPGRNAPRVRLSVDQSTNQLIARGSPTNLAQLEALLKQLDKPIEQTRSASDINVRLIWLTTDASGKVPADVNDVTDALADMGVTGLGMAAQTIVRATHRSTFNSEFVTGNDDPWMVHFTGTAHADENSNWTMEISVDGRQVQSNGEHMPRSVEFSTRLSTQTGHFVVLGVSPIGDADSVFVLQVVKAD